MAEVVGVASALGMLGQSLASISPSSKELGHQIATKAKIKMIELKNSRGLGALIDSTETKKREKAVKDASIRLLVNELIRRYFSPSEQGSLSDRDYNKLNKFSDSDIENLSLILFQDKNYYVIPATLFKDIQQAKGVANNIGIATSSIAGTLISYIEEQNKIKLEHVSDEGMLGITIGTTAAAVPIADVSISSALDSRFAKGFRETLSDMASQTIHNTSTRDLKNFTISQKLAINLDEYRLTGEFFELTPGINLKNTFLRELLESLEPEIEILNSKKTHWNTKLSYKDQQTSDAISKKIKDIRDVLNYNKTIMDKNINLVQKGKNTISSLPKNTSSFFENTSSAIKDKTGSMYDSFKSTFKNETDDTEQLTPHDKFNEGKKPGLFNKMNPFAGGKTRKNKNKNKRHSRRRHKNKRHSRRRHKNKRHSKRRTRK